jgi:hypothetical protein
MLICLEFYFISISSTFMPNLRASTKQKTAESKERDREWRSKAPRTKRRLTQLMGISSNAVPEEQVFFLSSSQTSPEKIKSVLPKQGDMRSPSKMACHTPKKGSQTTKIFSPKGSAYNNQGKIKIERTASDGAKTVHYASLFFPEHLAPKGNRINFSAVPPAEFNALRDHITTLQATQAHMPLPEVLSVTADSIQLVRTQGKKNKPQNKSVMGGISAVDALKLGGLDSFIDKGVKLHWMHIKAAYLAGQFDSTLKRSRSQVASNLIAGTAAANGHMLMIEMAFQAILSDKDLKIDEIQQSETIDWLPGYEGVIAECIHYKLSIPGCEITYDLDPWTLNKVPDNKQDLVAQFIATVFSTAEQAASVTPQKIKSSPILHSFQRMQGCLLEDQNDEIKASLSSSDDEDEDFFTSPIKKIRKYN